MTLGKFWEVCVWREALKLEGLHEKHAVHGGVSVAAEYFVRKRGKQRETLDKLASSWMLTEFWSAIRRRKQMRSIKYIKEQQRHFVFIESLLLYYTYLLTPWCRVLLEKLTGLQLVKKFPAFYGTRRFITALTSVRHLSLS